MCAADCRASLHAPVDDPWGMSWDGFERPQATYLAARSACEAIGGRLPTATEIIRAGVRTAAVGDGYQTDLLWTIAPLDATNALAVRLSNGTSSSYGMTALGPNHRCVCPPARPAAFTGSACYTTGLGDGCAPFPGDPGFNMDAEERTALPRVAAAYECALAGGELPTSERLIAALAGGLPNLTAAAIEAADAAGTGAGQVLTVTSAAAPAFVVAGPADYRAFRCIGPAAAGIPAAVADAFVEPRGERKMDAADRPAAPYATALFDCLSRGGHLPTSSELMAFAVQGLPAAGQTGQRWSADHTTPAIVETFAWPGTAYWPVDVDLATTAATANGIDATQAARTAKAGSLPYRCVYHAVRPGYAPPAAACAGGSCLTVAVGTRARMWFQNRPHGGTTSDTYLSAVTGCAGLGGRLASVRDLVEAIHAGLENPYNAVIHTSDFVDAANVRTLQWSGTYPSDPDPNASFGAVAAGSKSYVCMWTDEIR
jgi:hypothetical protein